MPRKDPEARRAYYMENREKKRLAYAAWHTANRERKRAYSQKWREENRAHRKRYDAEYARNHRQQRCENQKRRSARKRGASVNDFTHEQWIEMQSAYNHRCVYCGKRRKGKLTQDHITPLAQGGNHTRSNIVPACKSCNSKKHTGAPLIPVQPLLL